MRCSGYICLPPCWRSVRRPRQPTVYYNRCRKATDESAIYIAPDRLYLGEPDSATEDCRVISVRPTVKGHCVNIDCVTGEHVKGGVYLWLNARGHLGPGKC
jgi:hypothetical protein